MDLGLSFQAFKDSFFSAPEIERLLAPGAKKAAGKMGGYVRRVARNSLKYGPGHAGPGQPPVVHQFFTRQKKDRKTGAVTSQSVSPLRELLFYAWDQGTKSVVVGPVKFSSLSKTKATTGNTIPGVLKRGGGIQQARIVLVQPGAGTGRKATVRQRDAFLRKIKDGSIVRPPAQERVEIKRATIKPHPYMAPALVRSLPKFSSYFANSLTGGSSAGV